MTGVPRPRPLLSAVLVLLTLAAGLLAAPSARAADPLLSQGRPATASSTEQPAFVPARAVDGDNGTRWASAAGSDPQWLQVDLGVSARISQVVLRWEAAYARRFQIQTSANGQDWTTVHTETAGAGGVQTLTVSGTGRYVRMLGTERATIWGYSLWELQVHGTTGGTTTPPGGGEALLSYGRPGVASSYQHNSSCWECLPARAFDRDPASRWATAEGTGWTDPGWIYVDLGAQAQVTRVVLQWDPAYARSFQLQVSDNAQTWTTIYSTTSGAGFKQNLTVSGTGRYVRMYGTQRATPYGYSLWEFQVYGTGGAPITPPPLPPDPGTALYWSDEFNGAAGTRPDPAKWKADPGTGPNQELEYYTDHRNAAMDGQGNLVMEARREVTAGSSCPVDPVSGSGTCQYTSARMNTSGRLDITYGRLEARIRVPSGAGFWPAFWMLGSDFTTGRPWPYSGEIDIMEILGREPNRLHSTLHAPAYFGGNGYGNSITIQGSFADAFHVYAVDWNSRGMRFTMDGQVVHTVDREVLEATRGPWVFDHNFFIILNLAVGGDWPGPPNASTPFPARMLVDYVRVYR
jgi:beta-glucanase (GH16 family)